MVTLIMVSLFAIRATNTADLRRLQLPAGEEMWGIHRNPLNISQLYWLRVPNIYRSLPGAAFAREKNEETNIAKETVLGGFLGAANDRPFLLLFFFRRDDSFVSDFQG